MKKIAVRQSFVLCATIGAQSDFEYLDATAMTTPKMKMETAVPIVVERRDPVAGHTRR